MKGRAWDRWLAILLGHTTLATVAVVLVPVLLLRPFRRDRTRRGVGAVPGVDVAVPAVHRPHAQMSSTRPSHAAG